MLARAQEVSAGTAETASEGAFERLFVEEYRRVVAIAQRIVGDGDEAEDIAQDVFASFHGRHDPQAPFAPAWLHRAASHLALNAIRSRKRRFRREEADALASPLLAESVSFNPEVSASRAEERRHVRTVLSRIPKRSAQVLALRYSGLSYAEVATVMSCSVRDVGTMLRRAEAAFRKEYDREARI